MFKYILQRIGAMLLTLFLVMALSFMIIRLMPMSIFENPEVSPEIQYQLEEEMHLHDPIPVQLFYFIEGIVTELDFGTSVKIKPGVGVFSIIADRIPPTVALNFLSLFISIPLGLIAGTAAALKRNTWVDTIISFMIVLFISIPSFVFASLMQYCLTYLWPIFPTLYDATGGIGVQLYSMILPILALALGPIATIGRYLRGELIENLGSEYLLGGINADGSIDETAKAQVQALLHRSFKAFLRFANICASARSLAWFTPLSHILSLLSGTGTRKSHSLSGSASAILKDK